MKYRRYAEYKDSGVEWLGEVPAHWEVRSVWMLFVLGRGRVISHEEIADNLGDYPVYSSQTENYGEMGRLNTFDFDGDYITWTTDGANAGTVFVRHGQFNCTNVCGTLKAKSDRTNLEYFAHVLNTATSWYVRQDINPKLMNNVMAKIRVPFPCPEEQSVIASYLDRETTQIDALIARQERLIAVLQEKRQALISYAVTKGLNPDAPMKDSGVEWLGEVPAHWEVAALGKVSKLQRGHDLPEPLRKEGPYPVITSSGPSGFHDEYRAKAPGVVTGRYGTIGEMFFVEQDYWPLNTSLYVIDFFGNLPRFIYYLLMNLPFDMYSDKSAVPGVNRNHLHTFSVARPPLAEQTAIVAFLDSALLQIDGVGKKVQCVISKLQERRGALISAAVTGKIDVRNQVDY